MAAALFGIFAVVLQISGTFSSRPLHEYDRTGRFWSRKPPFQQWDYMTLHELQDFHSPLRSPPVDNNFEHQLLPSSWINDRRDSVIRFGPQMPFDNAAASGSATPSSIPKSKARPHLRIRPKESRKGLLPKILPGPRPIVMDSSSLSSTVQSKINDEMYKLKDGSSLVLQQEHLQPQSDGEDGDLTTSTLHATTSTENLGSEITIIREDEDKKLAVEEEADKKKPADGETSEITTVHEDTDKEVAVEEESDENKLTIEEKNENTTVQEGKEENTDVGVETTTPLEQAMSETTPDNSAGSDKTVFTESPSTSTREGPENSSDDTTETADSSNSSILEETTVFVSDSTREATPTSLSDSSPSEGTPSTTHPPISPTGVTHSPVSGDSTDASTQSDSSAYTSTESKSSESVTEAVTIVPEHVINISSIKKARIAITVVFLVIGLIAVAVLAVYVFRERRKAVQYDQLTLLP